jgi:hypothetical protein
MGAKMRFSLTLFLIFVASSLVMAGNVAQQVVTYQIDPINEISINWGTNSLAISFDNNSYNEIKSATWAITTNETNKRVMGSIDAEMPPGIELYVELEAPKGSSSNGPVSVSTNPQNLVTHISKVAQADLKITYKLAAETDTSKVKLQRVLTLVLTDGF